MRRSFLSLAFIAASLSPVNAADPPGWHFIRGSDLNGHSAETRLADQWPAEGPPVLWTRTLGQGYSSFVAWQDRLATQYQSLGGQYVICLNADTGKTVWEHWYDWPFDPAGVYPGPRATPTYHNGKLYFAAPNGLIGCLDADDGSVIWEVNVIDMYGSKGTGFGYACSPTLIDDKVLLPVGGDGASMVALDARDGTLIWKAGSDAASYTPAYPITFQGRELVIGYMQNMLVCHDLNTGKLQWRHPLSAGYDEHSAWPVYREPYLWISSPFRAGSELHQLTGQLETPLKLIWHNELMSNDIASSVMVDGAIFGFDVRDAQTKVHRPTRGQFRCIDFLTGEENWSIGDPGRRRKDETPAADAPARVGHATMIYADGKLYLFNDTGELIMIRASSENYKELGRVSVLGGEIVWTAPTIHNRCIYVRNHSRAACLYIGEAAELTESARSAAITTAEIPQAEYVDVAAVILGVEPEYAFDLPTADWLWTWFCASLAILVGSMLVAGCLRWLLPDRISDSTANWVFWSLAFSAGASGTTLLSNYAGDFIFTWQVSLFSAFMAACHQVRIGQSNEGDGSSSWRARAIVAGFIFCCVGYFLICRRLSLVFEWVFLCGFALALPPALAAGHCFRERKWGMAWRATMTLLAFAAFYWSAVAMLRWKSGTIDEAMG